MNLIGIEEHYLTTEVRDAWDAIGLAATDPSVAIHAGEIERRLLDLAGERIALMDETGLDVQVLSLTTPALHDLIAKSDALSAKEGQSIARAIGMFGWKGCGRADSGPLLVTPTCGRVWRRAPRTARPAG